MKLMTNTQRPSALLSVCAPVSGVAGTSAASAAHASVGYAAARGAHVIGAPQIQAQMVRLEGTTVLVTGLTVQGSAKADKPFGDVRGIPPRGRPV